MNRDPDSLADDDLELSLETLDQWETELDQFAAGIMQRLSSITGSPVDTGGLIPPNQQQDAGDRISSDPGADNQAMQLLQSLREITP